MADRVTATSAALQVIADLQAARGPLVLFQSGGCCGGTAPVCVRAGELPIAAGDLELGRLGGTPFYIDAEQDRRWGRPTFLIDVGPGAADGLSLEGVLGVHFVTRTV